MKIAAILAVAGLAGVASAQWTAPARSDGDASYTNSMPTSQTTSAASATADFRTAGLTSSDHLFSNWWWTRAGGDTREFALASPTGSAAVTRTDFGTNAVQYSGIQPYLTGANAALRFTLTITTLDLDGPGGNRGSVTSTLSVTNTGSAAIGGVNLFNYVDYFFTGEDGSDRIDALDAGVGVNARFGRVTDVADTQGFPALWHLGVGATGYGFGAFSAVGGQVGDTGIDNFADFNNATAATGGDISGVMQWNFGDVGAGETRSATAILAVVPTPGTLALLGLGGLVAGRRNRR
jgi:hypothetical protein